MMSLVTRRCVRPITRRRNHHSCSNYFACLLSLQDGSDCYRRFSTKSTNKQQQRGTTPVDSSKGKNTRSDSQPYRSNNDHNRRADSGKLKLLELKQQVDHLRQRLFSLPELPPVWSVGGSNADVDPKYRMLVSDARDIVNQINHDLEQGRLDKKFAREISLLLEQTLLFFRTSFDDCQRVMTITARWNLDTNNHKPALEAACREGRWEDSSNLFSRQVDPDRAGFTPMEIDLKEPLGLYAIARHAQQQNVPVAEQVMDAVTSMSMVNPTDQDKYVLAAGSALGRVGAWKELVDYQTNSYNSARLGQSLIGAVMYACILSGRPDEAIKQFTKLTDGPGSVSSEWQWGGGIDVIDPVVRDIAMRAGGSQALGMFRQANEEGFQISWQAVAAVVDSCNDVNDVFDMIEHFCHSTTCLVDGDCLNIIHNEAKREEANAPSQHLESILLPILRNCNHAGQFAMSLLAFEILTPGYQNYGEDWQRELAHRVSRCSQCDETMAAIMTALCGLESVSFACLLFDCVTDGKHDEFPFSFDIYQYVRSEMTNSGQWLSAHAMIAKLLCVVDNLPDKPLTSSQTDLLLAALAKTAQACNGAGHPDSAIFLMRHIQKKVLRLQEVKHSMGGVVRSFLGIKEDEPTDYTILTRSDPLLAESLRSHNLRSTPNEALDLFETVLLESKPSYESMPLSINQALHALVSEGRASEALVFFQSLDPSVWTPDMFVTLAKALEKEEQWTSIGDLYHSSLKSGCLTETMGILAMKAAVESPHLEGKIRVLRGMVKEICLLTGLVENEWQYSRYWLLKQSIGIRYSRLLMWWNDQRTSDLFELQLAIDQFMESKAAGSRPNHDVLRAIVRHCQHYPRLSSLITQFDMKLPAEKTVWADLLISVIPAIKNSPLCDDPSIVEGLVMALRTVDAHTECEKFVSDALSRGISVHQSAVRIE